MRTIFDRTIKTDFFPSEIGDYELISLWLERSAPSKKQYILDLVYTNFSIYEDIYSNCLSGKVGILDSTNLLSEVPIIGEEYVQICFRSMNTKIAILVRMRVTGISEIERVNTSTNLYTLFLTSDVAIINEKQKISRSYHRGSLSAMVSDICKNYLNLVDESTVSIKETNEYIIKEKDASVNYFTIETESGHVEKYVVPSLTPFRTINKLCKRSVSKTGSLFFFFQDINRFRFVSLEDIFKRKRDDNRVKTLVYIPKDILTKNKLTIWNIIYDYKIVNRFDIFKNMSRGMYSSNVDFIDLEKRNVKNKRYYYQEDAKKQYHVNDGKSLLSTDYTDFLHNSSVGEKPLTVNEVVLFQSGDYESQNFSEHRPEMYQRRMSIQSQIDSLVIQIEMPGDSSGNINVGDIVYFYVPEGEEDKEDIYLTGKYLVTRIHHSVDKSEKYKLLIEMITDTISEGYRTDKEFKQTDISVKTESEDIVLEADRELVDTSLLSAEIQKIVNEEKRKQRLQLFTGGE